MRATRVQSPPRDVGPDNPVGVLLTLLIGLWIVVPSGSAAQEGCVLGDRGRNDTFIQTLPGIGSVTYIGGAYFSCAGGVEIFADSAVAYQQRRMSELLGNVRYIESERELRAARAQYFTDEGRLQAQGQVVVVDRANGSSVRNGDLVYLLQTDFRDTSEMTVTTGSDGVRPTAVLTPPPDTSRVDSTGVPLPPDSVAAPYTVDAHRIFIRGSGYFAASGDVVIERDSLVAYADSAEYDEGAAGLDLVTNARVVGTAYELTGRTITMANPGGEASEVRALRDARLVGADVLLTAARIVVMLRSGALDRLVATTIAPTDGVEADSMDQRRPEAVVDQFVLTADSLTVSAPGEQLQRVVASGTARSVSTARDSLNTAVLPEIARTDWLEGDTVIIRFVGSPPLPPITTQRDAAVAVPDPSGAPRGDSIVSEPGSPVQAADSAFLVGPDSSAVAAGAETSEAPPVSDTTEAAVEAAGVDAAEASEQPGEPNPSEEADVEEIIARGRARSLYRLPANDSTYRAGTHPPAVHYVVGREIRIRLESGGVAGMQVAGQTRGFHLEPLRGVVVPDSARIPPDSAAVPDTTVRADTAVVPDTGRVHGPEAPPGPKAPKREVPGEDEEPIRDDDGGAIRLEEEQRWTRR